MLLLRITCAPMRLLVAWCFVFLFIHTIKTPCAFFTIAVSSGRYSSDNLPHESPPVDDDDTNPYILKSDFTCFEVPDGEAGKPSICGFSCTANNEILGRWQKNGSNDILCRHVDYPLKVEKKYPSENDFPRSAIVFNSSMTLSVYAYDLNTRRFNIKNVYPYYLQYTNSPLDLCTNYTTSDVAAEYLQSDLSKWIQRGMQDVGSKPRGDRSIVDPDHDGDVDVGGNSNEDTDDDSDDTDAYDETHSPAFAMALVSGLKMGAGGVMIIDFPALFVYTHSLMDTESLRFTQPFRKNSRKSAFIRKNDLPLLNVNTCALSRYKFIVKKIRAIDANIYHPQTTGKNLNYVPFSKALIYLELIDDITDIPVPDSLFCYSIQVRGEQKKGEYNLVEVSAVYFPRNPSRCPQHYGSGIDADYKGNAYDLNTYYQMMGTYYYKL
eukprot:Nk52_evm33s123 gene=Nk52_evmTU33s123